MRAGLALIVVALDVLAGCGRVGFAPGGDPDAGAPDDTAVPDDAITTSLTSRGVLVRYFLDDGATGQTPATVGDALAAGFDLPLAFDSPTSPHWTSLPTGRALAFETAGLDGGACRPIEGKLLDLDGLQAATIEVRVAIVECSIDGSRFLHIGEGSGWAFSLGCLDKDRPLFSFADSMTVNDQWVVNMTSLVTLTLVYDSAQAQPAERVRLYADGIRQSFDVADQLPNQGQSLSINPTHHLCIGNRFVGARTPRGAITYAALYTVALTDPEIADNVAHLARDDDRP